MKSSRGEEAPAVGTCCSPRCSPHSTVSAAGSAPAQQVSRTLGVEWTVEMRHSEKKAGRGGYRQSLGKIFYFFP